MTTRSPVRALSPGEDRAQRRAAGARWLRRALVDNEIEQSQMALDLGVTPQDVSRWCDANERKSMPAFDVEALAPVVRRAFIERIAEGMGLVCVPAPEPTTVVDDVDTMASVAKECADVVAALAVTIRQKRWTAHDGAELERECAEAESVIAGVRLRAHELATLRVDGIRRVK